MCGVCGFWAADLPSATAARDRLQVMSDAIVHRGPDGSGLWHDAQTGVGFAHRRLSIIDLSESGLQPMRSASGRFTICFNGEVFNFGALRHELARLGAAPKWRGHSDTEVMLAAIEHWGLEGAVGRFVGMFAFALWDSQERTLSLVRDRLGIKPLYWSSTPNGLCFGSELKSLTPFPGFSTTIDRRAVAEYLGTYCVPAPRSIYDGTSKLEPGTIATFASAKGSPTFTRYWSAAEVARAGLRTPFRGTEREAVDELDRLLREVVGLRMVADVPLGAFLSGGIDSSTVVAMMQAQSSRPVHTFSIESDNPAYDEGAASRAVAAHLGTHHTPLVVTAKDSLAVIPKLPLMYDEPFADSSQIPTFLVSQLARRSVTVALSGDGGDELFGGYNRHVYGPRVWAWHQRVPKVARWAAARAMQTMSPSTLDALYTKGSERLPFLPALRVPGYKVHKLASVMTADSPDSIHAKLAGHWQLGDGVLAEGDIAQAPLLEDLGQADVAHRMMYRDLVSYLPDDILTKVDRASMAVSLEARVPLLDHRLVAFAWSLPLELKVRGSVGKWALREVLSRYVPSSLVSGPKMGFGVPIADWLRGPLADWVEDLIEPGRMRSEGFFSVDVVHRRWQQLKSSGQPWHNHLWDVLMFQSWLRAHPAA